MPRREPEGHLDIDKYCFCLLYTSPLMIRGRHDVCVALRGAVVVEAAVAIALARVLRAASKSTGEEYGDIWNPGKNPHK